MINQLIARVIGSKNERDVKKLRPVVDQVNAHESRMSGLSDQALAGVTVELRARLAGGATLDDVLPEAFAAVREAGKRVLGMRHFDVQLIGGLVLHQGRIAEMKTGEGKTLVATLPAYLNALEGKGVHVVTVNDYLAHRDSEWMGRIYRFLGLSVGVIQHDLDDASRRAAYGSDITYGTNNEFGFDFLRDNMKYRLEDMVQRGHRYAIVDEVDSILVDEARTPLIISGPTDDSTDKYYNVDKVIPQLRRDVHYQVDEKHRTATFTEEGNERIEKILNLENLFDPIHMDLVHQLHNALKAHTLFKRDVEYLVKDGQVVIVDEFTGRQMPGRRWSDGLHQAVEAKERVKIERESQTYATITFQNYFRMYKKLAGMTGTAETEAAEFHKIYKLDVTVIPTNRKLIRHEHPDIVYRTEREKFNSIVRQIVSLYARGQPVLVGTISIEKSERLSELLLKIRAFFAPRPQYLSEVLLLSEIVPEAKEKELDGKLDADRCRQIVERPTRLKELLRELGLEVGETAERLMDVLDSGRVPHVVLNAKHHEREAEIVAQAGRIGAVTIATNMAGRGTDILLGGNPEFMARSELGPGAEISDYRKYKEAVERHRATTQVEHDRVVGLGGLFIIGSERHESRRIDNQLRGRAGRQGDPGAGRFYLSLEDDLMRIFGSDRISGLMQRLGMEEDEPIVHGMVTRAIERAQKQVEAQNFSMRKHLLEYDDVMNKQRETFYELRRDVLEGTAKAGDGAAETGEPVEPAAPTMPTAVDDYLRGYVLDLATQQLDGILAEAAPPEKEVDFEALGTALLDQYGIDLASRGGELTAMRAKPRDEIRAELLRIVREKHDRKEAELDAIAPGIMRRWEQEIILFVADGAWRDHLYQLDHLKEGIGLRGYAQRDPLVEYKRESFQMFEGMWETIESEIVRRIFLFKPEVRMPAPSAAAPAPVPVLPRPAPRKELTLSGSPSAAPPAASGGGARAGVEKVGRNDPCPCGSGKKYKKCHG